MTIVFVGGGTLGHLYPALPVIREWKKKYPQDKIVFISTSKETEQSVILKEKTIDQGYFFPIVGINRKNILRNFKLIYLIPKSLKEIKKIIQKERPNLVIGMGGYLSGLVVYLSQRKKIPTIIHEGNSVLGLANKMVLKRANYLLSAFDINFHHPHQQVIGNPRQDEAEDYAKSHPIIKQNSKNILVVSGTLGAKVINKVIIEFLKSPESREYSTTLITGKRYFQEVLDALGKETDIHYHIIPYSERLLFAINMSDIVVSRAGSTTLFEIVGMQKPALIIPSPNVSHNHQVKNALSLLEKEAIHILYEKDLNLTTFFSEIKDLFNPSIQNQLKNRLAQLQDMNSTHRFIGVMEQVIKR